MIILNTTYPTAFVLVLIFVLTTLVFITIFKQNRKQLRAIKKLKIDSEQKYHELADLLPQIVFECDYDGNIIFMNANGQETFGLNRIDLINGVRLRDLILKNDQSRFLEDFYYIRTGGLNKGQEYIMMSKNGQKLPAIFFMSPIVHNDKINGIRGIAVDLSEQKRLERKVLSAVIDTEDHERQRFSEDLHDGLGPLLSTIKLYVNQLQDVKLGESERKELIKSAYELLEESISSTRQIANNILPGSISDNGLIPALNSFCHKVQSTKIVEIHFKSNIDTRLNSNLEKTLYRICIELINNTIKHAGAKNIYLIINKVNQEIQIDYRDDGHGFDLNNHPDGLGLANIRNRSLSFNAVPIIKTEVNKGFLFQLQITEQIN